jgi:hypothetical protein
MKTSYPLIRSLIKKRIEYVTKNGKYETARESFITNREGLEKFIFSNYEEPFPKLSKFPRKLIPESKEIIIVSTLDTEILDKPTLTDFTYSYLFNNRGKEISWGGINLYISEKYIEIYDNTAGLHYSTFILF